MVERITDPHRPVSLRHGIGRIPDGGPGPHGVPQPSPPPPAPLTLRQMAPGLIVAALVAIIMLTALVSRVAS